MFERRMSWTKLTMAEALSAISSSLVCWIASVSLLPVSNRAACTSRKWTYPE